MDKCVRETRTCREIAPFRSMNLAVCESVLDRYADEKDLRQSYETCGLNGLEVIRCGEPDQGKITADMVNGVHLYFHIFWMDWWFGRYEWLDGEFDSREQWIEYYGGMDREAYLSCLRKDLDYAEEIGANYVVFHVSEVDLTESYTRNFKYTDEEVVDASLEVINALLEGKRYSFDFLVENLWWSGFTLLDTALTRRLIEGIHYDKKGIMLDTGHFMNTNTELKSQEEGISYLHSMLSAHERAGLLCWFKGMHLQKSVSGAYVKKQREQWGEEKEAFEKRSFYERFAQSYAYVGKIDEHQPFTAAEIKQLVERVRPTYLTFELKQESRERYEQSAKAQGRALGIL